MFVLRISVTPLVVEKIKAELTKSLPDVKSSIVWRHWGRGLGFHTYAALRSALHSATPVTVAVTARIFSAYLNERGFEVEGAHLYRAAAQAAIQTILDTVPRLNTMASASGARSAMPTVRGRHPSSSTRNFWSVGGNALGQNAAEAFLRSLALLARVEPTKTIRSGTGSYRLKHIAENYVCTYPEGGKLGPDYVPNGMLIAAALHMGFKYRTHVDDLGYDTQNASFNMSKVVIDDLDVELRPRSGLAQDRARAREMREARKQGFVIQF